MSSMRKLSYGATVVAMVLGLIVGVSVAGDHKDYAETSEKWEAAYNAKNAAGIAALYTEDGVMMPPNAEAMTGRKAIEAYLAKDIAGAPGHLDIETVDHDHSGHLGYARGTWAMHDADGNVVDKGKWVEVRKKVQGTWMILVDTWNSDMPKGGE